MCLDHRSGTVTSQKTDLKTSVYAAWTSQLPQQQQLEESLFLSWPDTYLLTLHSMKITWQVKEKGQEGVSPSLIAAQQIAWNLNWNKTITCFAYKSEIKAGFHRVQLNSVLCYMQSLSREDSNSWGTGQKSLYMKSQGLSVCSLQQGGLRMFGLPLSYWELQEWVFQETKT